MPSIPVRCACGALRGTFAAEPAPGARGVCYCDDCQAYGRFLGSDYTDPHGGTAVVQAWPAQLALTDGLDGLRLVRLSEKGLLRWYAGCCRAPLANCMARPKLPFTGVMRTALDVDEATLDSLYGKAWGVQGRFAPGGCPPGAHPSASVGILWDTARNLARGWWRGAHVPTPFFDASGATVVTAQVLTREERVALG